MIPKVSAYNSLNSSTADSVSYTHLDVYKRQGVYSILERVALTSAATNSSLSFGVLSSFLYLYAMTSVPCCELFFPDPVSYTHLFIIFLHRQLYHG